MMAGSRYSRRGLYRSRDGEIFGVCKGIAQWRDLPVGPIRLAVILLAVFTGFAPVIIIYLLAALVLPPEPKGSDKRFYDDEDISSRYQENRKRTVHDLKREFDYLKQKVSNMEGKIFDEERDKEQEWEQKFKENR